jgi:hypothetical protein
MSVSAKEDVRRMSLASVRSRGLDHEGVSSDAAVVALLSDKGHGAWRAGRGARGGAGRGGRERAGRVAIRRGE